MYKTKKKVTQQGSPFFSALQAFLPVYIPRRYGPKEGVSLACFLQLLSYSLGPSMSRQSRLYHFSMWFPVKDTVRHFISSALTLLINPNKKSGFNNMVSIKCAPGIILKPGL